MAKILNFGSLNIDKVYGLASIVSPGETVSALTYEEFVGGKGLNQSVALARAGADVYHGGLVGEIDGEILTDYLKKASIKSLVKTIPGHSGHAIIQVDRQGQNSIIVEAGANKKLDKAYIDQVFDHFSDGDYLLIQNEINQLDYIIKKAVSKNMQIFFNPSPIDEAIRAIDFSDISTLVINQVEGESLSGQASKNEILSYFRDKYPSLKIVLTLGSEGGIYAGPDEEIAFASYPVQVVDTTGAGDTFLGYFVASLAGGLASKEALELGSAAGALACTKKGAANSVPKRDELVDFMKEMEKNGKNSNNI